LSKYGWCKAYKAEIRLFGSNATNPANRSTSSSSRVGVCSIIVMPLNLGNVGLKSLSLSASGQLFSFGVPNTLKILNI
jgi:hypothetical protein